MEIQLTTTMTWKDWDAWRKTRTLYGKVSGSFARGLAVFLRIFGIALLILGGVMIVYGLMSGMQKTYIAIGILCLPGGLLWAKKRDTRTAMNSRRIEQYLKRQMPDQELQFLFTEEGFSVTENDDVVEIACKAPGDRERTISIAKKNQKLDQ